MGLFSGENDEGQLHVLTLSLQNKTDSIGRSCAHLCTSKFRAIFGQNINKIQSNIFLTQPIFLSYRVAPSFFLPKVVRKFIPPRNES